jgi:hypothetical protein
MIVEQNLEHVAPVTFERFALPSLDIDETKAASRGLQVLCESLLLLNCCKTELWVCLQLSLHSMENIRATQYFPVTGVLLLQIDRI